MHRDQPKDAAGFAARSRVLGRGAELGMHHARVSGWSATTCASPQHSEGLITGAAITVLTRRLPRLPSEVTVARCFVGSGGARSHSRLGVHVRHRIYGLVIMKAAKHVRLEMSDCVGRANRRQRAGVGHG